MLSTKRLGFVHPCCRLVPRQSSISVACADREFYQPNKNTEVELIKMTVWLLMIDLYYSICYAIYFHCQFSYISLYLTAVLSNWYLTQPFYQLPEHELLYRMAQKSLDTAFLLLNFDCQVNFATLCILFLNLVGDTTASLLRSLWLKCKAGDHLADGSI